MNKWQKLFLIFFLIPQIINAEILAGAAKIKITPLDLNTSPVLAGFNVLESRYPNLVHQDLYARALVIKQDNQQFCFVAVDLLGMAYDDIQLIKEEFPNLVVGFTHTHSAPDVIGIWSGLFNRSKIYNYKNFVISSILNALRDAQDNLQPALISFSSGQTFGLSNDNRVPLLMDESLEVMSIKNLENDYISIMVNWSAHPINFNRNSTVISSDYPGALTTMLDKKFDCISLFFNGAIGGQISTSNAHLSKIDGIEQLSLQITDPDTGEPAPVDGVNRVEIIAKNLLIYVSKALENQTLFNGKIKFKSGEFDLYLDNSTFTIFKSLFGNCILSRKVDYVSNFTGVVMTILMIFIVTILIILIVALINAISQKQNLKFKQSLMIIILILVELFLIFIYTSLGLYAYKIRSNVNYMQFGNVAEIITVPGEIYPELSIGAIEVPDTNCDYQVAYETPIKSLLTSEHKFVIGLGNDEIGYIIPKCLWDEDEPYAYHRRGMQSPQYNEDMSLGPDTAGTVIDKVKELIERKE